MFEGTDLFWFGLLLEAGFVLTIVMLFRPVSQAVDDRLATKHKQLKQDYQKLQQESQQQKGQLTQDRTRLRQELQQQNDHLMQEHLRYQREWQQQQIQLVQERDRLQQQLEAQIQERDRLQQQLTQQTEERDRLQQQLTQQTEERDRLKRETDQQIAQLVQERLHLQEQLQHQAAKKDDHLSTFRQLQTLLVNYPSASKIAQARPNLSAKTLTSMFAPLENLLDSWGYQQIGAVWEKVAYDPKLHQPDAADIQPGEPVYIRFVGYRNGEQVLCPAKVSRKVPGDGQ
jgi:chromosome segregation ATPase